MSVQELESFAHEFCDSFNRMDFQAGVDMMTEDVEIFDSVPCRIDGTAKFMDFLNALLRNIESMNFGFHQLSCRMITDDVGTINAHDTFSGVTKDGQDQLAHGRTTLVCHKQGGQWKVVTAHFSAMPRG
jgi:ketosteroid isomerase-like protein